MSCAPDFLIILRMCDHNLQFASTGSNKGEACGVNKIIKAGSLLDYIGIRVTRKIITVQ
jgi:hypothetical protein